ncbi:uncharacterized protein J3D65DRAFT_680232 [Phyllosticta citribraziliensis]|uniref:Uncharacterized protein n=1 Tax=Phyllosticta citribraziliensis TaxID=989973 RepID=A0ABR1LB51_9PEZI
MAPATFPDLYRNDSETEQKMKILQRIDENFAREEAKYEELATRDIERKKALQARRRRLEEEKDEYEGKQRALRQQVVESNALRSEPEPLPPRPYVMTPAKRQEVTESDGGEDDLEVTRARKRVKGKGRAIDVDIGPGGDGDAGFHHSGMELNSADATSFGPTSFLGEDILMGGAGDTHTIIDERGMIEDTNTAQPSSSGEHAAAAEEIGTEAFDATPSGLAAESSAAGAAAQDPSEMPKRRGRPPKANKLVKTDLGLFKALEVMNPDGTTVSFEDWRQDNETKGKDFLATIKRWHNNKKKKCVTYASDARKKKDVCLHKYTNGNPTQWIEGGENRWACKECGDNSPCVIYDQEQDTLVILPFKADDTDG